jgi:hypothetical protein
LVDSGYVWLIRTQLMAIAHVVTVYYACARGYSERWMEKSETRDRSAIMKVRRKHRTLAIDTESS